MATVAWAWAALWAGGLLGARRLRRVLTGRPAIIPVLACLGTLPVALDGGLGSVLISGGVALVWVAAVTAGPATTLVTGAVLAATFVLTLVLSGTPVPALVGPALRYDVATNALNGLLGAGAAIVVVGTFRGLVLDAPRVMAELRAGAPASTEGLTALIAAGPAAVGHLPPPTPEGPAGPYGGAAAPVLPTDAPGEGVPLTAAESAVVRALASGSTPKEIARDRDVALATVRTQLKRAKRKTGARTLAELATRVQA